MKLEPRRVAWIAVGLAGLPGAVFGTFAIVIGVALGFVAAISFAMARFAILDYAATALSTAVLSAWMVASARSANWLAVLILFSVYCAALALAKLGRIAGRKALGTA